VDVSASTVELLQAFEKLPPEEREEFVQEVLRRVRPCDGGVELRERGIDEAHATDLRARLKTFAEDWDRPEAAIYDENPTR
jgi:hypothetical protein